MNKQKKSLSKFPARCNKEGIQQRNAIILAAIKTV